MRTTALLLLLSLPSCALSPPGAVTLATFAGPWLKPRTAPDTRPVPIASSYRLERTEPGPKRFTIHAGLTFDACMHRLKLEPKSPLGCVPDTE